MKRTAIWTTLALVFHLGLLAAPATAAAGDLDSTFGNGGTIADPFGFQVNDLAIQSDGRIVAAGYDLDAKRVPGFAVARYLPSGQPDPTFGEGGGVKTDLGCSTAQIGVVAGTQINAVVVQRVQGPAGIEEKILVAGGKHCGVTDYGRIWTLARYETDGSLDPTFGANGIAHLPFSGTASQGITDVVLDSLGRIVAVGPVSSTNFWGPGPHFAVARLLPNGAPDPSFGVGGISVTPFPGGSSSFPHAVALTSVRLGGVDVEAIVAAGSAIGDVALARYLPNGAPDVSFGTNGTKVSMIGLSGGARDLAVQADGKLVVAAGRALARFHPEGALDESFGVQGEVSMECCCPTCYYARSIAVQDDGKVVAGGETDRVWPTAFAVARYLTNGELDPSFAGGSVVSTAVGAGSSRGEALELQPDGMILLAGFGRTSTEPGFALARYQAAGPPPTRPAAPSLTATGGDATAHLEWTTPANGGSPITGYRIYRGTASGQETLLTSVGTVNSFDDTTVSNGTRYFYRVSAVNSVGEGARSSEASATPGTVPGAPSLKAAPAKPKGVALTWTTPADGGSPITGYRIYRGTATGGETFLEDVGTGTSYKDTSTTKGTSYFYVVRAVNTVGEGPASNEASARAN